MVGLSRLGLASPSSSLRRLSNLASNRRAFGSAAAVQYDYEDDEDYYRSPATEEAASSRWERGVQWLLIGEPRGKRRVYAEELSKLLEVPRISMGSLLKEELNPRSSLYKQVANALNEGKPVPEDVILRLLSKRLEEGYNRGENGFILDGIPRTRFQAETLDQITQIDLVVNFKSTQQKLVRRALISEESSLSAIASERSAWKEQYQVAPEERKALEEYYREQYKLLNFQIGSAPEDTWLGLLSALHIKHLNAASSSQKLVA